MTQKNICQGAQKRLLRKWRPGAALPQHPGRSEQIWFFDNHVGPIHLCLRFCLFPNIVNGFSKLYVFSTSIKPIAILAGTRSDSSRKARRKTMSSPRGRKSKRTPMARVASVKSLTVRRLRRLSPKKGKFSDLSKSRLQRSSTEFVSIALPRVAIKQGRWQSKTCWCYMSYVGPWFKYGFSTRNGSWWRCQNLFFGTTDCRDFSGNPIWSRTFRSNSEWESALVKMCQRQRDRRESASNFVWCLLCIYALKFQYLKRIWYVKFRLLL